jgi:hypothetical protein
LSTPIAGLLRLALALAVHHQHAAQAQGVALVDELEDFAPCARHAHAVQVEARLGGIATLLELAEYTVLDTGALELEDVPGIQGLHALVGEGIAVAVALRNRRGAPGGRSGVGSGAAVEAHALAAPHGLHVRHLAQKVAVVAAHRPSPASRQSVACPLQSIAPGVPRHAGPALHSQAKYAAGQRRGSKARPTTTTGRHVQGNLIYGAGCVCAARRCSATRACGRS